MPTRILRGQQPRIIAQDRSLQQTTKRRIGGRVDFLSPLFEGPLRRVAAPFNFDVLAAGQMNSRGGHFVARQRAGFVGANHTGRSQGLHGRKSAHNRPAPRHSLHSHSQCDGHGYRQSLRNHRHHLADRDHQDVVPGHATHQSKPQEQEKQNHRRGGEPPAELADSQLQRCGKFAG